MSYGNKKIIRKRILDGKIEDTLLNDENKKVIRVKINNTNPYDRITCEICGKEFIRSCRTTHKGTKYHQQGMIEHDKFLKSLKPDQ